MTPKKISIVDFEKTLNEIIKSTNEGSSIIVNYDVGSQITCISKGKLIFETTDADYATAFDARLILESRHFHFYGQKLSPYNFHAYFKKVQPVCQ